MKERKKERRKEGKKERRKERKKERKRERKKERKKVRKKERRVKNVRNDYFFGYAANVNTSSSQRLELHHSNLRSVSL